MSRKMKLQPKLILGLVALSLALIVALSLLLGTAYRKKMEKQIFPCVFLSCFAPEVRLQAFFFLEGIS